MQKMICCIDWTFRHSHKYRDGDVVCRGEEGDVVGERQTPHASEHQSCIVSLCKVGMMQAERSTSRDIIVRDRAK